MRKEKKKKKWTKISKGQEKQEIIIVEKCKYLVQISSIYVDKWRKWLIVEKLEFLNKNCQNSVEQWRGWQIRIPIQTYGNKSIKFKSNETEDKKYNIN